MLRKRVGECLGVFYTREPGELGGLASQESAQSLAVLFGYIESLQKTRGWG
jgi:hypothetical protein